MCIGFSFTDFFSSLMIILQKIIFILKAKFAKRNRSNLKPFKEQQNEIRAEEESEEKIYQKLQVQIYALENRIQSLEEK